MELPWPSRLLAGHAKGHWRSKAAATKSHREWARLATLAEHWLVRDEGDIRLIIAFYPPSRRVDRPNMPHLVKSYLDGIADALGVNDRRFLPSYVFGEPVHGGRVVITIDNEARPIGEIVRPILDRIAASQQERAA